MNLKSKLLLSGLFLFKISFLLAQDLECGTGVTDNDLMLLKQFKSIQLKSATTTSEIRHFPI